MTALATSSQAPRLEKYDVFISFRGSDVRNGFISHLAKQLQQEGINVYVDKMLKRGEEISSSLSEAIERSLIALVIFSKDYASSRWCLEELVKIMECKRVNNQIVIPIFYNIDPSHVRHHEGPYADAFAHHEQKYNHDLIKLQIWRSVLKETANLSGYHSSNFQNESDLIDGIIKEVWEMLDVKGTIEPKRLMIGFEKNLSTIESFLKVDSQEVGLLGIWAKGGMGKTTLARAIFDKFSHQFDNSYFAPNVREESKKIGLDCLLEKIRSSLTIKGRTNTQKKICRTRVLLVLDDVNTPEQLQSLIEENTSLGPNSKVIITSRNKHVLISGGVHVVHELEELDMEESLQLFCWHAFKQHLPKQGYEKLSVQAIEYARGIPLALKVLGSYLNSRDTPTWDDALKKFRKHPHPKIQTILMISYDDLDETDKRLFLDIAFFFRGEEKEDVISMLGASDGFYPICGIDNLVDKALITISRDDTVEIHDLLYEMAEVIVREESIGDPGRRSRLNEAKEIQDVLKDNKGTDKIEGIKLEFDNLNLSAKSFQKMSNLRFLKIQPSRMRMKKIKSFVRIPDCNIQYPRRGLHSISNKLRYFYWEGYPFKTLPSGFCPKELVEIHLNEDKIQKLWSGVQDLTNLKIINLRDSKNLKELPDLSKACNLEIVDLKGCFNLRSIHPSILSLPKLLSLNLSFCFKLKNLHGDKHLKTLKHLMLFGCSKLKEFLLSSEEMRSLDLSFTLIETLNLPIGRFNKLEVLTLQSPAFTSFQIIELSSLTFLKKFSLSFYRGELLEKSNLHILFDAWRFLEELRLIFCKFLEIPENISSLSLLKILSLQGSDVESLPHSINHLSQLKQIDLKDCHRLRFLPELPSSVTHLDVFDCTSLETMDFTLMRAICNNMAGEVKVCYPGSKIPEGFKYSQTKERTITIELAPPSSSDPLLGFVCCCILSPCEGAPLFESSIYRKFQFENDEIHYKDEMEFKNADLIFRDHVYVWYDPMERILKGTQRRRYDEDTNHQFTCEFLILSDCYGHFDKYDHLIKACGLCPIYASDLQGTVQQMEFKLDMGTESGTETEVPVETETETKVLESVNVFQRFMNFSWMPHFSSNS